MSVWDIGGQSLGSMMLDKYFHGAAVHVYAPASHTHRDRPFSLCMTSPTRPALRTSATGWRW